MRARPPAGGVPPLPHRRRGNTPEFSEQVRADVFARSGGRCEECGRVLRFDGPAGPDKFHAGHKLALSAGGQPTLENARALCQRCNLAQAQRERTDRQRAEWDRLLQLVEAQRQLIAALESALESATNEIDRLTDDDAGRGAGGF